MDSPQESSQKARLTDLTARLWTAAERGSAKAIASLLAKGADPQQKDLFGCTALMLAAKSGSPECLNALLGVSDPNERSLRDETALMFAAKHDQPECLALLLPRSNPDFKDSYGKTALMLAASFGNLECVALLLPISNALETDQEGRTALMLAACGHPQCVAALLPASDPLAKDNRGDTALMAALAHATHVDRADLEAFSILLPISDLDAAGVDEMAKPINGDEGRRIRGVIAAERERRALRAEISTPIAADRDQFAANADHDPCATVRKPRSL